MLHRFPLQDKCSSSYKQGGKVIHILGIMNPQIHGFFISITYPKLAIYSLDCKSFLKIRNLIP